MNAYNYPVLSVSHVPTRRRKKTEKGLSVYMYQRGRTVLGGARARGWCGTFDLIHDLSVKPFPFFYCCVHSAGAFYKKSSTNDYPHGGVGAERREEGRKQLWNYGTMADKISDAFVGPPFF